MNVKQIILGIAILLIADFLWISLYMGNQYKVMIRSIQGSDIEPKSLFIILAYLLMIIGLIVFVLPNIRKNHELEDSIKYGFVFGIVLYGVYDFTAGAVISKWDTKLTIIDILWGGIVFFMASYFATKIKGTFSGIN